MSSPTNRSSMQRALRARDDGLRRVSAATRALVIGAVAVTGLFTILASRAQPVRTKISAAGQGQAGASAAAANAAAIGAGNGVDANLSPPAAPPVPSYQYSSPSVVSGAS